MDLSETLMQLLNLTAIANVQKRGWKEAGLSNQAKEIVKNQAGIKPRSPLRPYRVHLKAHC